MLTGPSSTLRYMATQCVDQPPYLKDISGKLNAALLVPDQVKSFYQRPAVDRNSSKWAASRIMSPHALLFQDTCIAILYHGVRTSIYVFRHFSSSSRSLSLLQTVRSS